jgi:hypothetical protein
MREFSEMEDAQFKDLSEEGQVVLSTKRNTLVEQNTPGGAAKTTVSIENLKVALAFLQRLLNLSSGFQIPILACPQASLLSTVQLVALPASYKRETSSRKRESV